MPSKNRQVKRLRRTMIQLFSKLSSSDKSKCYKNLRNYKRIINSTVTRSTNYSTFELTRVKMKDSGIQDFKRNWKKKIPNVLWKNAKSRGNRGKNRTQNTGRKQGKIY